MKNFRLHAMRLGAATLLAIVATSALAQGFGGGQGGPPPGGPGGRGGGMRMGPPPAIDRLPPAARIVTRPEVADELGLTDEQRQSIFEALEAQREGMRPPQGNGDGPPDFEAMRAARDKAEAATDAKVTSLLSAAQAKRLGEIQIQSMGLTAAMVPAVQTKLGLTEDQKAKLKTLVPARGERGPGGPPPGGFGGGPGGGPPPGGFGGGPGGGPPQGGPGGRGGQRGPGGPGGPGGMDPRRQQLEKEIGLILTSDQKAVLKTLGGKELRMGPQGRPSRNP
jgi:hypothetical protein